MFANKVGAAIHVSPSNIQGQVNISHAMMQVAQHDGYFNTAGERVVAVDKNGNTLPQQLQPVPYPYAPAYVIPGMGQSFPAASQHAFPTGSMGNFQYSQPLPVRGGPLNPMAEAYNLDSASQQQQKGQQKEAK